MIAYLEDFLGLSAGALDSLFGYLVACAIFLVLLQTILKIIISWIDALFGRR